MATQRKVFITVEQYLALEKESLVKHEYLAGEMFAMAGSSRNHSRIAQDTGHSIARQFAETKCEDYNSDLRVRTGPAGLYTYPDLSIVCGESVLDGETLTNPTAIIEVLSDATEAYDRGEKFRLYQRIPSLLLYILISQDKPQVEVYERKAEGCWSYGLTEGLQSVVELPAIGCVLSLADVYARIHFEETVSGEDPVAS
jgi:Uma2 family endonuclease